jgi:hypothetical protein
MRFERMNDTDFIKNLVKDIGEEKVEKPAETSRAFKIGVIAGGVVVAIGTLCLEAALFALVATTLGWKLTFLQGLSIAALFEFVSLRFLRSDS